MKLITNLEDIIGIQNKQVVQFLRVRYSAKYKQLVLNIDDEKLLTTEYKPISNNIEKEVIESILKNSKSKKRKDSLETQIIQESLSIAITTRRNYGNYAIFSESYMNKFLKSKPKTYDSASSIFNEAIICYVSPYLCNGILIGYSPRAMSDTGMVLSLIDNRYQIYAPEDANKYYRYIE